MVDAINEALRPAGVDVTVYLVDREQRTLRPLPRSGRPSPHPQRIDATIAGRCFMFLKPVTPPGHTDRLWTPILDGSDRLGVAEFVLPGRLRTTDREVLEGADLLTSVIGYLVVAKGAYGDTIRRARRSRAMSTEGELLWRALPPLTFATADLSLAALLEPSYEVGGDAFDYAIDHGMVRVGIFDAVGHGLAAAVTSTLTLAATRAARAAGLDLPAMAAAADRALSDQFGGTRYTTAILGEIDQATGVVRYLNAGHPPALVIRRGRVVSELAAAPRAPLGIPEPARTSVHELQPEDRLLFYTDGITEARDAQGRFFGWTRLLNLAERYAGSGYPAAEALRRLTGAVLDHQGGKLQDDATLMLVEWSPGTQHPIGR